MPNGCPVASFIKWVSIRYHAYLETVNCGSVISLNVD